MRYRNPFQNRRNANVLRDNSDVTIGLAVLFLLSAVFAFGIIALLLVKKGYFKIDEKNVFLRATKCITLSAGLALLLVFSSCAGLGLRSMFFPLGNEYQISFPGHVASLAPQALKFFLELSAGLFAADLISRKMNMEFVKANSLRIGLFLSFTSVATGLTYLFEDRGFMNQIAKSLFDVVMSPVSTALETLSAIQFFAFNPNMLLPYALDISVFNMSNVFNYEPLMGGLLLVITAISFLSTLARKRTA